MNRTFDQYLTGATDLAGTDGGTTSQVTGWDFANVTLSLHTDVVITTPLLAGTDFRATLASLRDRTYVNPTTAIDVGFANLDLQVWDSSFTTLYSESTSLYNQVELLDFNLPQTTTYGLRVVYTDNMFGSITQEDFGLAWDGCRRLRTDRLGRPAGCRRVGAVLHFYATSKPHRGNGFVLDQIMKTALIRKVVDTPMISGVLTHTHPIAG